MSRREVRSLVIVLACLTGFCVPASVGAQHGGAGSLKQSAHASIWSEQGVGRGRPEVVAAEIDRLFARIGRDLGAGPPRLEVRLFTTHGGFARALQARQKTRPQSSTDDSGAIVGGTLLLGPLPDSYLRHNLAHVYTEWLIDRLTGNRSDALPSMPWLYDGLAEYEAYRYEPAGMRCVLHGPAPLHITTVRTARQWLALRAGPLGALAYCLAYARTRAVVQTVGWARVRQVLHRGWPWLAVAHVLVDRHAATQE